MFDRKITCCFSGHRPEKITNGSHENEKEVTDIKKSLSNAILNAINLGYENFICGMSRGIDLWAAEELLCLKNEYKIKIICAIPFEKQDSRWNEEWQKRYHYVLTHSDYVFCLSKRFSSDCFHVRNRFMADNSSLLICYYDGTAGGTEYTVNYAKKLGLEIVNLADNQLSLFNI